MPIKLHYRAITSYRELPARIQIVESETSRDERLGREVYQLDRNAADALAPSTYDAPEVDLLGLILGRQATEHAATASSLSKLILNRKNLTQKQISDIQWRMDDLMGRRPIQPLPEGKIAEAEKMIIDLERQKRQAEVNEWRDLLELRRALVDERKAYEAAQARWRYLSGGTPGPVWSGSADRYSGGISGGGGKYDATN